MDNVTDDSTDRQYLRPHAGNDDIPGLPPRNGWPRTILWAAGQIVLFFALVQMYKTVRKTFIARAETVAFDNAKQILHIQEWFRYDLELHMQRWVLERGDLIKVFNYIYAWYMYGFYACAIVLLVLAPGRYLYLRRVFIISMLVALPWYFIYPLAPPRFMQPYGWPFVDTLAVYGPNYFSSSGVVAANRLAAMPSMHCGWTLVAALMITAALPWRNIGRAIGTFLVVMISATVMITGNHYWLDILGGWAVIGVSLLINRWLPYPLPLPVPWSETRPSQSGISGHSAA